MPTHVYANNNEIASKASEGKSIAAFPDVCFSPPAPPVGPMPLPYPNTGECTNTDKGTSKVFIKDKMSGMEGDSNFSKSMGDESATQNFTKGMITSAMQGKCYFGLWSMDVQMEGKGVPRHLDMVTHNHASQAGNACKACVSRQLSQCLCEKIAKFSTSICYIYELCFVNFEKFKVKDLLKYCGDKTYEVNIYSNCLDRLNMSKSEYVYEQIYNPKSLGRKLYSILNSPDSKVGIIEKEKQMLSPAVSLRMNRHADNNIKNHLTRQYFAHQNFEPIDNAHVTAYDRVGRVLARNICIGNCDSIYLVTDQKSIAIVFDRNALYAANAVRHFKGATPNISNEYRDVHVNNDAYDLKYFTHSKNKKVTENLYIDKVNIILDPVSIRYEMEKKINQTNFNFDLSAAGLAVFYAAFGQYCNAVEELGNAVSKSQVIKTENEIQSHVLTVSAKIHGSNDSDLCAFVFDVNGQELGYSSYHSSEKLEQAPLRLNLPAVLNKDMLKLRLKPRAQSGLFGYEDSFEFMIYHKIMDAGAKKTAPVALGNIFTVGETYKKSIPTVVKSSGSF